MSTTMANEATKGEMLKVEFRRVIRAGRQRVFDAWTRPEELRKWFGPGAIRVAEVDTEPHAGGSYHMVMKGSIDGNPEDAERRVSVVGAYTAIVPGELIAFTWKPDWTVEDESLVTVRLREVEGGTELHLIHERIASQNSCGGYSQGWTSCLDKLGNYLSN